MVLSNNEIMKLLITVRNETFVHESDNETIKIGRSPDNDFVIEQDDLSRKHCVVTIRGNYFYIMDLGSKNGTLVDGVKIIPHQQYPVYPNTHVILANFFVLKVDGFTLPQTVKV